MWRDTKPKFDSSILQSVGGEGKAFAYLGQGLTEVDKQIKDEQKTKATIDLQNKELDTKNKQVAIMENTYKDTKTQNEKTQNEKTAENNAKVKTMREYLSKQGIDTKNYSDSDILYAGDTIEKVHTDKSDLKFSQFVYNNKTPYAVYKDKNDNLVTKPLFENSVENGQSDKKNKATPTSPYGYNPDGSSKTALQFGEEQTAKRIKDKYGSTAALKLD